MNPTQAPRDAGLTLVELLVVLALMGMMGVLAASGLRAASVSWQRTLLRNSESEELFAIEKQMRQLVSRASSEKLGSWSHGMVRFEGTRDHVNFLAPLAPRFGAQDIVAYTIGFTGDSRLSIVWQLDRGSLSGQKSLASAPLEETLEGAEDGAFAYFGATDSDQPRWRDSWQAQQRLPQLVRMRFNWRGQSEELIIAPLTTAGPCSILRSDLPCSN
ncbi:hypothetical protein UB31_22285 [Bradyrhizobium sp. LTSP849]|nr:hypothetical protein UB31_22285 [Bradyrhizobium sp. LTSP849]